MLRMCMLFLGRCDFTKLNVYPRLYLVFSLTGFHFCNYGLHGQVAGQGWEKLHSRLVWNFMSGGSWWGDDVFHKFCGRKFGC